jgi:hypothetical protein
MARVLDRPSAQSLLGERVVIARADGWTARLPDGKSLVDNSEGELGAFAEAAGAGEPDDATLHHYISTGEMHKYVEGCATASPAFADMLAELVETLLELGESDVAFLPRRWLKQHKNSADQPIRYAAPVLRLAAADSEQRSALSTIDLGSLSGLAVSVNATLEVSGQDVALRVDTDGELSEIGIGGEVRRTPEADGSWLVRCRRTDGPLTIRVQDSAGGVFEDALIIDAEA